jgi:hypothetical protein
MTYAILDDQNNIVPCDQKLVKNRQNVTNLLPAAVA